MEWDVVSQGGIKILLLGWSWTIAGGDGDGPSRTVVRRVDPIESQRPNLSGSWHSGRSQHEQYLGHAGSSVQNLPHCRHSKNDDH